MRSRFEVVSVFTVAAMVFWPGSAWAQSGQPYPNKLVRIVTSPPGTNIDLVARLIAQGLGPNLGQSVVVENHADLVAIESTVKATPDGYMLLVLGNSPWMRPLMQKISFDAQRDLIPITEATSSPLFLYAHPSLPAKSARDLIALAKDRPGTLNYGMPGPGSSAHLAAELFNNMAGTHIVRIAYKGSALVLTDVIANQVQIAFAAPSGGRQHVAAGKLKVLGVSTIKPSALAPDVPTIAASGLPGFDVASTQFMWVPAGTPKAVVDRLNDAVVRVLSAPDLKKKLLAEDVETVGLTSEQTIAYISAEIAKWGKLIKEAGLRSD